MIALRELRRHRYDDDYVEDEPPTKRQRREDLAPLSDWTLHVTDGEGFDRSYEVHRVTLARASPFFHAAFTTPVGGRRRGGPATSELRLPTRCCAAFEAAVDFMYGEPLPDGVEWLCAWLAIARELDVPKLRDTAIDRVEDLLEDVKNEGGSRRRRDLTILYAHACELRLEKLRYECEVLLFRVSFRYHMLGRHAEPLHGDAAEYDEFPVDAVLSLLRQAADFDTPRPAQAVAWVTRLVARRLCAGVGPVACRPADDDARDLLDGLARAWASLWWPTKPSEDPLLDDDTIMTRLVSSTGIEHVDEAVELLRLSIALQGGSFLTSASPPPRSSQEEVAEAQELVDYEELEEEDPELLMADEEGRGIRRKDYDSDLTSAVAARNLSFPIDREFYGDKWAHFDQEAVVYAAGVLEYLTAEWLETAGYIAKARIKKDSSARAPVILESDIWMANSLDRHDLFRSNPEWNGCPELPRSLSVHPGRCLQAICAEHIIQKLSAATPSVFARLPLDVAIIIWTAPGMDANEDAVFDSIRAYLDETSAAPEVRSRAWGACSFAHLSSDKMSAAMGCDVGVDPSTLLKGAVAARYIAEGAAALSTDALALDRAVAKARATMENAGLLFNDKSNPASYQHQATFVAGAERGKRPVPYYEVG